MPEEKSRAPFTRDLGKRGGWWRPPPRPPALARARAPHRRTAAAADRPGEKCRVVRCTQAECKRVFFHWE